MEEQDQERASASNAVVAVAPSPFSNERHVIDAGVIAPGSSIETMIEDCGLRVEGVRIVATVNAVRIAEEDYATIIPGPGDAVALNVVPGGGDDGKVILSIVIGIATLGLGAAGLAGFALFGAEISTLAGVGLVLGGVLGVASGLQSLLASPPGVHSLKQLATVSDPTPLGAARNQLGHYAPFMRILGKQRVFPYFASKPFTTYQGADQFAHMIFDLGHGPLSVPVADMKFGETPILDFAQGDALEYYVHQGFDDDPSDYQLVGASAQETVVNIKYDRDDNGSTIGISTSEQGAEYIGLTFEFPQGLFGRKEYDASIAWVAAEFEIQWRKQGGSWQDMTDIEESNYQTGVKVYVYPDQHVYYSTDIIYGNVVGYLLASESFNADYPNYPRGGAVSPTWGYPAAEGDVRFVGTQQGRVVRGLRWQTPDSGDPNYDSNQQYDIKVRRIKEDAYFGGSEDRVSEEFRYSDAVWTVLRSEAPATKPDVQNICLVEIRIKNSDSIPHSLDQFNCIATSILPFYSDHSNPADGIKTWTKDGGSPNEKLSTDVYPANAYGHLRESVRFSDCFAEILRGAGANSDPLADDLIDAASLEAWDTANTYSGEFDDLDPDRTFGHVFYQSAPVFDQLKLVAAAGRASVTRIDNKFGVIVEEPRSTLVQHFAGPNISNCRGTRYFRKTVHGMRVAYVDVDKGYQSEEIVIYLPGYDESNATEFGEMQLVGSMKRAAAAREAHFQLKSGQSQQEIYQFDVDIENLVCTRGDLCRIQSDVILVGVGAGRIVSANITAGSPNVLDDFYVNVPVEVPAHLWNGLGVRIRTKDGESLVAAAHVDSSDPTHLVIPGGVNIAGDDPQEHDMVIWGEVGSESREVLIRSVTPRPNLGATITCVDYVPEVFDADADLPPFDPGVTLLTPPTLRSPTVPTVTSIKSDESVLSVSGGSLIPAIVVDFVVNSAGASGDLPTQFVEAQYRIAPPGVGEWSSSITVAATERLVRLVPVDVGSAYELRLRSISGGDTPGRVSAWTRYGPHVVVGWSSNPAAPTNARVDVPGFLVWDYGERPIDFKGFEVRYELGTSAVWETAKTAHLGYLPTSVLDLERMPDVEATYLIRAVDVFGNYSDALTVTHTKDAPDYYQLISVAADPTWSGTKTNCSVSSTNLVADADEDGSANDYYWSGNLGLPFWSAGVGGSDSDAHWSTNRDMYAECTYYLSAFTIEAAYQGAWLYIDLTFTANSGWKIEYKDPNTGDDEWSPFLGKVWIPYTGSNQDWELLFTFYGGRPQMVATDCDFRAEAPKSKREYTKQFSDSTGTHYIDDAAGVFREIKGVVLTVTPDATDNSAITARHFDLDATNGPSFECYDSSGSRVAGYVDAIIVGVI